MKQIRKRAPREPGKPFSQAEITQAAAGNFKRLMERQQQHSRVWAATIQNERKKQKQLKRDRLAGLVPLAPDQTHEAATVPQST